MAFINSPSSGVSQEVETVSKASRVILYDAAGNPIGTTTLDAIKAAITEIGGAVVSVVVPAGTMPAVVTDGTSTADVTPNQGLQVAFDNPEDMTGRPRRSPDVTQLGATPPSNASYELSRVKIAIGGVGQDDGDPTPDHGLPTENRELRWLQEQALMHSRAGELYPLAKLSCERGARAPYERGGRDGSGRM